MSKEPFTPDTDARMLFDRICEMQRDLVFLFLVQWRDVDRVIQLRVLKAAIAELRSLNQQDQYDGNYGE